MKKEIDRDSEREAKKEELLRLCFFCMVESGIERISMRDFSRATGMTASNLYYWFRDKDEIVLDAVEWGLNDNINRLFGFAFDNTENLNYLCVGLIDIARDKSCELRLVFQIATSPQYGKFMRSLAEKLEAIYQEYTGVLAKKLNVEYDKLLPLVNLFIAAIVRETVWDNWDRLDIEMNCVVEAIKRLKAI